ncbi:DUF6585 family protein [Catellatospora tritici]|uniref:DUF6585 family protein n=1 Tax=Catellatospora tritici TaxID=2851566 RepID=UPI001C2D8B19|nr:DUF6585 family protein [Catellatospora tritici]MBV1854241.1 hypothetical protein [Catellatospora tritici]
MSATDVVTEPVTVTQAAATAGLGEFRAFHRARNAVTLMVVCGMFALMSLGCAGALLVVDTDSPMYDQHAAGAPYVAIPGLVFLVPLIWLIVRSPAVSAKARRYGVYEYEHGFVHLRAKGVQAYRYEAVQTVHMRIVRNNTYGAVNMIYDYNLVLSDGRKLQLGTYAADMAKFGPVLAAQVAQAQLPKALAYFDQGNPVTFGRFTVSEEGVSSGKKLVAWSELAGITVAQGRVSVLRTDGKSVGWNIEVATVPNLYTMLALVDKLQKKVR